MQTTVQIGGLKRNNIGDVLQTVAVADYSTEAVVVNRMVSESAPASGDRVRGPQTGIQTHLDAFPPLILPNDNFEKNLVTGKRAACREYLNNVADHLLKELNRFS